MNKPLNISTIPFSVPFAHTLAQGILTRFGPSPEALSRVLILLPSRRACRTLREAFLRISDGKPMLLPRLQPLGDIDEDEVFFLLEATGDPFVKPASTMHRQLLLARLLQKYDSRTSMISVQFDQSVMLSRELLRLMDEMEREQIGWDGFSRIVPQELAEHWQVTLDFLSFLKEEWPALEEQQGAYSPTMIRNRRLAALADVWRNVPPAHPVIAAGSTGSNPAVSALLHVIAGLPLGEVVLSGVDTSLPPEIWESMEDSHPQFGFKRLLSQVGCAPADVALWSPSEGAGKRDALLSMWMLPAAYTDTWRASGENVSEALSDIHLVQCRSPQEEATHIALLLRETLEQPAKTAVLVTPDRSLARRVSSVLKRFGLEVDDSAGMPLASTPAGAFFQLFQDACESQGAIVPMLALIKHPLFALGGDTARCRVLIRQIEIDYIRGESISDWEQLTERLFKLESGPLHAFSQSVLEVLNSCMVHARASGASTFRQCVASHIEALEDISRQETGSLWDAGGGRELWEWCCALLDAAEQVSDVPTDSYFPLVRSLLSEAVFRPAYGAHPRLHILSPMEARLQHFDRVILAGLNEDSWPHSALADPWLSRPMRQALGLPSPERKIGQSAHDFCEQFASGEVFLLRSEKQDGVPTIASRWLRRLLTLLEALGVDPTALMHKQNDLRRWVGALDPVVETESMKPPAPVPPLSARPRELAVTRIQQLVDNPYSLYLRKILNLKPLDPLDPEVDGRIMGTVIHKVLECFVKAYPLSLPPDALNQLVALGREHFDPLLEGTASHVFWKNRFSDIAEWFIAEERQRRKNMESVACEVRGSWSFDAPAGAFRLVATADRVERHTNGTLTIIDYKTGRIPSGTSITDGVNQLLLEAVIAENGTFGEHTSTPVESLQYWQLKDSRSGSEITSVENMTKMPFKDLKQRAYDGVRALIATYDNAHTPYVAKPVFGRHTKDDPYVHLARMDEWLD